MAKSFKKKSVVSVVIVVVIVGIFAVIAKNFSKPSTGTIKQSKAEPAKTLGVQTLSKFDSQTFTFLYDSQYKIDQVETNKTFLEQHLLNRQLKALQGSSRIAVSIRKTLSGSLEDEPAYKIRVADPAKYKLSQNIVNDNPVSIFENISNSEIEVTAFTQNKQKGLLASISMSSAEISTEKLKIEFNELLNSFSWR